ncbi:MAG: nitroreductase family deazaflavin-dependent oxidoreductase [Anaerolineales bacterium]|nr:nitroreductase family deazaflavin-dependent oxidoreductase [Anaerolineales bacterium]
MLLITTFGRKSGELHTNPVIYIEDGHAAVREIQSSQR